MYIMCIQQTQYLHMLFSKGCSEGCTVYAGTKEEMDKMEREWSEEGAGEDKMETETAEGGPGEKKKEKEKCRKNMPQNRTLECAHW